MDAEATPEADSGRPSCDRAAAQGRLGRASDRAGAWPVAQRDQRGARPRHGRLLRRRAGTGRGSSAVGPVGASGKAGSPLFAEVAKLLRLPPEQIAGKRLEDGTEVSSGLRVRRST